MALPADVKSRHPQENEKIAIEVGCFCTFPRHVCVKNLTVMPECLKFSLKSCLRMPQWLVDVRQVMSQDRYSRKGVKDVNGRER